MKFIDVKSAIIGVLITLLFLSIYGFRPETDELGHLVVKSNYTAPKMTRSNGKSSTNTTAMGNYGRL